MKDSKTMEILFSAYKEAYLKEQEAKGNTEVEITTLEGRDKFLAFVYKASHKLTDKLTSSLLDVILGNKPRL